MCGARRANANKTFTSLLDVDYISEKNMSLHYVMCGGIKNA